MAGGAQRAWPPLEVMCIGEALVDFLPERRGALRAVPSFFKVVGGAPTNVAVGLARLGRKVGFLGKIGEDEFGQFLREALDHEGVDVTCAIMTREARTGITFVSLDERGERSFLSFAHASADMTLRDEDIDPAKLVRADIVLCGSNQMMAPDGRAAITHCIQAARSHGCFIVMDPNVRLHLWSDPESARMAIAGMLGSADIIKVNDEELEFLSDGIGAQRWWTERLVPEGVFALIVTHAEGGATVHLHETTYRVDAPMVEVVDTTGAGDGFVAGLVAMLCEMSEELPDRRRVAMRAALSRATSQHWHALLLAGCAVGSHVCTTLGATPGLPTRDQINWSALRPSSPL
jgi:fructokinase